MFSFFIRVAFCTKIVFQLCSPDFLYKNSFQLLFARRSIQNSFPSFVCQKIYTEFVSKFCLPENLYKIRFQLLFARRFVHFWNTFFLCKPFVHFSLFYLFLQDVLVKLFFFFVEIVWQGYVGNHFCTSFFFVHFVFVFCMRKINWKYLCKKFIHMYEPRHLAPKWI